MRRQQQTIPDSDIDRTTELQSLWAEIGSSAFYWIGETQGDCSVIELKVSNDLRSGREYSHGLGLLVAFVREGYDSSANRQAVRTVESFDEDDVDSSDRITLVGNVPDEVPTVPPPADSSEGKNRIPYDYVYLGVVPGQADYRRLLVRPDVELPHDPHRIWLLEITMGKFHAKRLIRPAPHPLIPRTK